jgi:hypothetical protein
MKTQAVTVTNSDLEPTLKVCGMARSPCSGAWLACTA